MSARNGNSVADRPAAVGRTTTGISLLGALAGWLVLEAFVWLIGPLVGLGTSGLARVAGSTVLPAGSDSAAIWAGRAILLAVTLLWGVVYAATAESLPGAGWTRGAVFGTAVWLVSAALILPLVGALNPLVRAGELANPGFLGLGLGGSAAVLFSLAAHLLFGATLGAVATPAARG